VNSPRGAGRGDLIISNEGQGLFGAAGALSNEQFGRVVAANLVGSIRLATPYCRIFALRAADRHVASSAPFMSSIHSRMPISPTNRVAARALHLLPVKTAQQRKRAT